MLSGSDQRQQEARGFAPLAARSERLTRSALRATAVGRIVRKEMHAADDGVGLEHQLVAGRRREHGRVVDQPERARMARQRPK